MSDYKHIIDYKEFSIYYKNNGKDHYKAFKNDKEVLAIATDLGIESVIKLLDKME